MPASHTVLVVGPDDALQRSMRFALEAEGFNVITSARLTVGGDVESMPKVSCVVLDEKALLASESRRAQQHALPVILLTDGFADPKLAARQTLLKPLLGRELIDAVLDSIAVTKPTQNPVRS